MPAPGAPNCLSDVPVIPTRHPETVRLWLPLFQPQSTGSGDGGRKRGPRGKMPKVRPRHVLCCVSFFFFRRGGREGGRRVYLRGSARPVLSVGGTARPSPPLFDRAEKPDPRQCWFLSRLPLLSLPTPRFQSQSSTLAGPSVSSGEAAAKAAALQRLQANRSPLPPSFSPPSGRQPLFFFWAGFYGNWIMLSASCLRGPSPPPASPARAHADA